MDGILPLHMYKNELRHIVTTARFFNFTHIGLRFVVTLALLIMGNFFQKYIVDAFYRVEVKRLAFIKRNQGAIRVERYKGRMYHLNSRGARLKKGAFTRKT